MRKKYDFSKMKSRKNPYAAKLKKPVTIRHSDEPISDIELVPDFLPSPEELALKDKNTGKGKD